MWGHSQGDTCHLLSLMVQGKDNRGRRTDNPVGLHPIQTIGAPTSSSPPFLMPDAFLPQPSQFILVAWDRHQVCWLAYPVAWYCYYVLTNCSSTDLYHGPVVQIADTWIQIYTFWFLTKLLTFWAQAISFRDWNLMSCRLPCMGHKMNA